MATLELRVSNPSFTAPLAEVDPEIAGQLLLSLSSGLFLQASLENEQGNWGKKLQDSIEILLNGLKRRN